MSLKIYCKSCGSPNEYSLSKPKFCQECGGSFETNVTANISASKPVYIQQPQPHTIPANTPRVNPFLSNKAREILIQQEEEVVEEVPKIAALDIQIDGVGRQKETFGGLVCESPLHPSSLKDFTRKAPKGGKKAIMTSWKNEAGAAPINRDDPSRMVGGE